MAKDKDRFTPSTPAEGASVGASRRISNAMATQPVGAVTVAPIQDRAPAAPRMKSPAGQAVERIRREVAGLALRAPSGEEVYLDVLDVRSDFEVLSVREASDEEIAFDGLDARGQAAKAVQHYTRLSYFLRTDTPPSRRERIGFVFTDTTNPVA